MQSFWQDMKYAIRSLRNSPSFAIIAVVTLGLGMAVNTTVFSIVNGLLLRPLPVPEPQQITVLAMKQPGGDGYQMFSYPDYQDIRSQAAGSAEVFGYRTTLVSLISEGKGDHCVLSRVTGNYFSALGVKPALGRLILPSEGQTPGADPVLVLGYAYWQKRFGGDKSVIGKQVESDGHAVTIIGVTPKEFQGTYGFLNMDGYIPLSAVAGLGGNAPVQETWTHREHRSISLMARLKPGVELAQARAALDVIGKRIAEQHPETDKGNCGADVSREAGTARARPGQYHPEHVAGFHFVGGSGVAGGVLQHCECFVGAGYGSAEGDGHSRGDWGWPRAAGTATSDRELGAGDSGRRDRVAAGVVDVGLPQFLVAGNGLADRV